MLIDHQNKFSEDQVLTATAISSNVIDLGPLSGGNLTRDVGAGAPVYLHVLVTTTLDSAAEGASLVLTLESDDNAALSSATVHMTLASIAEAGLDAGVWVAKGIPIPSGNYQRYLGLRYTVSGESFTTGKVTAWLSDNRMDTTSYESGVSTGVN